MPDEKGEATPEQLKPVQVLDEAARPMEFDTAVQELIRGHHLELIFIPLGALVLCGALLLIQVLMERSLSTPLMQRFVARIVIIVEDPQDLRLRERLRVSKATNLSKFDQKSSLVFLVLNMIWLFATDGLIILIRIPIVFVVFPFASYVTMYAMYDFLDFVFTYGGVIERDDDEEVDE